MNNYDDLPENSDTSDEDYVPNVQEVPSEIDSDGISEDNLDSDDPKQKNKKRRRKMFSVKKKKRIDNENKQPEENKMEEKSNVDDIWASFIKDTGFKSKTETSCGSELCSKHINKNPSNLEYSDISAKKPVETVKITQIFEFAGEEVKVEKDVPVNSTEARFLDSKNFNSTNVAPVTSKGKISRQLDGIESVLGKLGKKPKISTLEKSKLDWDQFKKEENLEEELETHNKGKLGYLERQDFLQRADLRRFEIEMNVRAAERSKRLNNTL